jgi:hypothetical protein
MNRAVVALLVSVSLLGCFPHSPQKRTYAKIGEGTAIVAGIAISAFANTAADCDQMEVTGINNNSSCESGAKWATTAGVVLIVGGLLGFVATVSTAEDEKAAPKAVEIKEVTQAKPEEKPAPAPLVAAPAAEPAAATTTDNTQATDPNAAGSASPTAPQK